MMAIRLLVEAYKSKRAMRAWRALDNQSQIRMSADMWSAIDAPSKECKILACARIRELEHQAENSNLGIPFFAEQ